jgi:hypothetical protein
MKPTNLLPAVIVALSMAACSRPAPQSTPAGQSSPPAAAQSSAAPAAATSVAGEAPVDSSAAPIQPLAGDGASRPRFRDADLDHDGRLSRTEAQVLPYVSKHFDALDTDHDGYVSRAELRASHDRMQMARNGSQPRSPATQKQSDPEIH